MGFGWIGYQFFSFGGGIRSQFGANPPAAPHLTLRHLGEPRGIFSNPSDIFLRSPPRAKLWGPATYEKVVGVRKKPWGSPKVLGFDGRAGGFDQLSIESRHQKKKGTQSPYKPPILTRTPPSKTLMGSTSKVRTPVFSNFPRPNPPRKQFSETEPPSKAIFRDRTPLESNFQN